MNISPVPGFENYYSVTEDGKVLSHSRIDARGHARNEKWLKPVPDGDGYPRVHLCVNGIKRKWQIHRLVALAFIANNDNKPTVNHIDGNKTNNDVSNLEWMTFEENSRHSTQVLYPNRPRNTATGQFMKAAK